MSLPKRYNPKTAEPALRDAWRADGIYQFDPKSDAPFFSIDTPPPTVSGNLHLGHVFSYSQTDFIARFWRMNGRAILYPMGFDDNGLPTERLVEKRDGVTARQIGREAFIERCMSTSEVAEHDYRALWQRLGLSIDWRHTYRTIDARSQRVSQWSFIQLLEQGDAYQQESPAIWCPECRTAIAQAELDDLDTEAAFYTLAFALPDGSVLPIATTRPELLPACVAIFVNPKDGRFTHLHNLHATTPLFERRVPILIDPAADPAKGTGAVMCCTFGDQTDIQWWRTHDLPLIEVVGKDGRLTQTAAPFAGESIPEARHSIIKAVRDAGLLLDETPIQHAVRVHERCDTPVEFITTTQWFLRQLEYKDDLLAAGEQIEWHPPHMKTRYMQWVENLGWDWCISRQRAFGVPIPVWTCAACGEISAAAIDQLPVDPLRDIPKAPCPCGSTNFIGESDVMDTWATSSMTPHIVSGWLEDEGLREKSFPLTLRPQAHEIIRTWAFYSIYKSLRHFGTVPFDRVMISGWALAPEGMGKISKSRGGGPIAPLGMIEQHSADAVRYWAASTTLGKDALISIEKVEAGEKLVTKLWNVSRFAGRFLEGGDWGLGIGDLSLGDRWLLGRTQLMVARVTALFEAFDYATAKHETETFFWRVLADNYLEMAKQRLYEGEKAAHGTRFALGHALLSTLKLFAPVMPFVTEQIYLALFAETDGAASIHRAAWPKTNAALLDEAAVSTGDQLIDIATAVRRYKSKRGLSLGAELASLTISANGMLWQSAESDLRSITRARAVRFDPSLSEGTDCGEGVRVLIVE